MRDKTQSDDSVRANLAAWEEVAPIHRRHNQARLLDAFRTPEFSSLDDVATDMLHQLNVAGKDVAQVCCNNGSELISVKRMGAARCVGFDGAQGFIDQAHELAQAADKDVEFVCCDIHDIPPTYDGSFDLVTITIGVLNWMPDIGRFFDAIAKLLRPGGAIFIYEHHPILIMLEPGERDAPVVWELSYFRTDPYIDASGLDYYGGEEYDATPNQSFSHKMSDIIMSGINAGLSVESFEEMPHHISNAWWNVEHSGIGLPMCFTLVLRHHA